MEDLVCCSAMRWIIPFVFSTTDRSPFSRLLLSSTARGSSAHFVPRFAMLALPGGFAVLDSASLRFSRKPCRKNKKIDFKS